MPTAPITIAALRDLLLDPASIWSDGGLPLLLVDLASDDGDVPVLGSDVPAVVVGVSEADEPATSVAATCCDVVVRPDSEDLEALQATVARSPRAAVAFCLLMRGVERRSFDDGLLVESATYSALQAGPEFARWRAERTVRESAADGDPVRVTRRGDRLDMVLTRPHVRNALNTAMRDALVGAFRLVALDSAIEEVHVWGEGPSFCAGGDLDEFGSFSDPASAHVVRLLQSAGRAVAAVGDRVAFHLHGACFGSGIEIPAFACNVVADPGATFALPEIGLGLIPGAGGTVSISARIGRHRTALLALTGRPIDAATALGWGLVDRIEVVGEPPD